MFILNKELQKANQFLFSANKKFQYSSNFSITFSFTLCTACNSKFQRLKAKDKLSIKKNKFTKGKEVFTTKMSSKSDDCIEIEDEDVSEFSEVEEYGIDEIKLQIIIEKKGKKTSTSKTLTIKPVEYIIVIERINSAVQKALKNTSINPSDYKMSYKAINAHGPSSELEDKLDFNEFIEDYKKVFAANKKMSIIVVFGDDSINEKSKSKHSKVKKILYFIIL